MAPPNNSSITASRGHRRLPAGESIPSQRPQVFSSLKVTSEIVIPHPPWLGPLSETQSLDEYTITAGEESSTIQVGSWCWIRTKKSDTLGGATCLPAVILDIRSTASPPGSADPTEVVLFVVWGIEYFRAWWKAGPKLAVIQADTIESAVVVCHEEGSQLVTDDRGSEERFLQLSAESRVWRNCVYELEHGVAGPGVQEGL